MLVNYKINADRVGVVEFTSRLLVVLQVFSHESHITLYTVFVCRCAQFNTLALSLCTLDVILMYSEN